MSLEWGYPASVFDADKAGQELLLRRGAAGEAYVFNPSGQAIDLEDLLVVMPTRGRGRAPWEPCGNPVKDAMATKVFEDAREIVAVVYAPASEARGAPRGLRRPLRPAPRERVRGDGSRIFAIQEAA